MSLFGRGTHLFHRGVIVSDALGALVGPCGHVAMWSCGYVAMWLCGCVAMWLCGCVAMWPCGHESQRNDKNDRIISSIIGRMAVGAGVDVAVLSNPGDAFAILARTRNLVAQSGIGGAVLGGDWRPPHWRARLYTHAQVHHSSMP